MQLKDYQSRTLQILSDFLIYAKGSGNVEAFEKIIRTMKEAGIGYGSVNHPVDRDPVCGFSGIIKGERCPHCGRLEGDVSFERLEAKCC